jgi:hypothetical protein
LDETANAGAGERMATTRPTIPELIAELSRPAINSHVRMLRTFQFQSWLLGTETPEVCFQRAGAIFGVALLTKLMHLKKKPMFSMGLSAVLDDKGTRNTLDRCFDSVDEFEDDAKLFDVVEMGAFPLEKRSYDKATSEITKLNLVVGSQLNLKKAGRNRGLFFAVEAIAKEQRPGLTAIKSIHGERHQREPFLYAASKVAHQFLILEFPTAGDSAILKFDALLDQIERRSQDADGYQRLFACAKAVSAFLEYPIADELESSWRHIQASTLDFDSSSLSKSDPRPAATETRSGDRKVK